MRRSTRVGPEKRNSPGLEIGIVTYVVSYYMYICAGII
jgi:hypothetical protein